MRPTEMALFDAKEQTLLVETDAPRLTELDEDQLDELLTRVRRARNKYSKLHRRQAAATVRSAGKRSATSSSNTRTLRKAEIFEGALARVSRELSKAARASATELRTERLAMARAAKQPVPGRGSPTAGGGRVAGQDSVGEAKRRSATSKDAVRGRRVGRASASTKRTQARRDQRG